ncbi:MAG: (2Fe-2S)-binding protein [Acidimicrobiales bacterium]|nr:(2Fe-2S)-binding protein [Acidimicrobiales bacterium]
MSDSDIRDAVAAGATTYDEVASKCWVGFDCGTCRPIVESLVEAPVVPAVGEAV